jgi:PAS domain S-box-containing protein
MSKKRLSGDVKKTSTSAKANFRSGGDKTDALIRTIFPGESEMAGRMRDFDWSTTDLGPPSGWPENLRITVRICLTSRFPIVVWWGPTYTTFYNDAYISFLGRTKHPQWLGRSGEECWQEIWPVIGPMLEGVFTTGRATWSQDLLLVLDRNLSQEEGYFTFSYSPILDSQNSVKGIFCACFETTEQVVGTRRLETLRKLGVQALETRTVDDACEEAARVLAENPYDIPFAAIYLVDGAGTRAELKSLAGFSQDDHPFPSPISVSDGDVSPWPLASTLRSRRTAETSDLDATGLRLPGGPWPEPASKAVTLPIFAAERENLSGLAVLGVSPRRVLDDAYRTFFGLIAGHIGTAISDAKAYEAEQKRAEALAELDRAKTAFFSNVSHEFRTPLTLMIGPLEDELRENPAARDRLEIAHRSSLRLLKLVNTLLDFSRIEAGRIDASYEPTDLAAYTAELASVFRSAVEKAGLRLVVDCPPLPEPVYVDREMWEKIVLNLLSNAFKFTFEGEIKVALRRRDERVELSVSDTGVGIPESELSKIFQRFHRVRGAKSRTHEGTGIGLALAQELARLHGGEIKARNKEGGGSTFTVSVRTGVDHLPVDRICAARQLSSTGLGAMPFVEEALRWLPDEAAVDAPSSADDEPPGEFETTVSGQPATGKPRVLVADDNADMRAYLKRLLEQRYDVEVVPDGRAALKAAGLRPPDLLLTDVMMPGLDGFGLLKELRADERTRAVPVIMLSARAGEEARVEGLYAGADDYLIKPFSARELVARVDSQLGMARLRRESEESLRDVNAELNRRLAELEKANLEILDSRRVALNLMEDAIRAKEALRESQERFRHMADNAPVMVWVTEPNGDCTYLSRSWYEFTGQTPETGLGFGWLDATHPDDREHARDAFMAANERRETFKLEYRLRRRDGEYRWVIDAAAPRLSHDREFLGYIGSVIDITERKRAEAFLACQKQSFEMAASGTPLLEVLEFLALGVESHSRQQTKVAIHLLDAAGERFSKSAAPSLPPGYVQATEGMEISSAAGPCCAAVIRGERVVVADVAASEEFPAFAEFALPLGIRAGWSTPIFSSTGKALGTVAYYCHEAIKPHLQDDLFDEIVTRAASVIIERKQAERALQENERRFREMLDALPAAVYTTDAEGRLTYFNPAAVEFSGRTPELGTDQWCVTWKLYYSDGTPMPHDECPMAIALKENRVVRGAEAVAERPDGKRIWFEPYPTPLRDDEGRVVGGINMLLDVT